MMHALRVLDRALARLEDFVVMTIVAAMSVLLFAGVILRYVFNDPLTWSEEFVVTIFVWSVMLGVPSALRARMHIRIDALILRLGATGRRVCGTIACAAALVIFVAAIHAGWSHTSNVASSLTPMLGYSVGWIFVSLPIGFALTLFHGAMILVDEGPEAVFRNATESVIDSAQA
ncbi:MAG: TRAP transporter small permease [Burkholderiales bacterium]|jgi:TRAP-type C4-dicarboxylate transport system permease small subunit